MKQISVQSDGGRRWHGGALYNRNAGRRTNPSSDFYTQRCDAGTVCVGHAGRVQGAAVAWVFSTKGCSNTWVADPSHGAKARQIKSRRLANYGHHGAGGVGLCAASQGISSVREASLRAATRQSRSIAKHT